MTNAAPAPRTRELDRCLACGGQRLKALAMCYEWSGLSFPAAECVECGIRFLRVQPAGETLAQMYDARYFASDFRCGHSSAPSSDATAFRREDAGLLDALAALGPRRRLLDVGCAYGSLLAAARERGWQARGVELSEQAVAHARGQGLEVVHGTLESAALPAASVDVVHMGDVLEHVPDCRATLAEVARVLAPGGHLWLRGPITTNSLARRIGLALYAALGRTIVLREPPYHLWEFTPRSLDSLLRQSGLVPISVRQAKIAPGVRYGAKTRWQSFAMNAIDAVNLPLTRAFNVLGDRAVVVARKGGH